MKKVDEKFFIKNPNKPNDTLEDVLGTDEKILLRLTPKKNAFVLESFFSFLPIALIWGLFDIGMIVTMALNGVFSHVPYLLFFIIPFFAIHLIPVWIFIVKAATANKVYKNTIYAFTDKRIIIRSGLIGVDFKSIYYAEVEGVNVKVGLLDKMFKVGDIYVTASSQSAVINDIEDPYFYMSKIQEIALDIKSDIYFPNNLRPDENNGYNTKYKK